MVSPRALRDCVPGFDAISASALDRIASSATERRYPANRVLYRAGDAADGLYIVLSGRVRVSRDAGARSRLLHDEVAGGVLGEIPVLGGGPFPATAVAVQATRCAHLSVAAVDRLVREEPEFARYAMQRLAARARSLLHRIDELTATTVLVRVARHVRARAEASAGAAFTLGLSQAALAGELDTAREVVVRALAALIAAGAIRRAGRSRFVVATAAVLSAIAAPFGESPDATH
ncbi:MAG TPA: Crp/Fnr family transcriptional regulator [Gemmatimonadaceae bacterium]|nr:Crp/Fnr family transcriptional regulator [Gemmatimonadaceae bacterium]